MRPDSTSATTPAGTTSSSQSSGSQWITPALPSKMTGDAFTTQRSALPKILGQIGGGHLDRGTPVDIQ